MSGWHNSRPVAETETTTVWADGQAFKRGTDGKTRVLPRIVDRHAVPPEFCPLCYLVSNLPTRRQLSDACAVCGDPAIETAVDL